jgi:hypothetical protein
MLNGQTVDFRRNNLLISKVNVRDCVISKKRVVCQSASSKGFAYRKGVAFVVGFKPRSYKNCCYYLIGERKFRCIMSSSGEVYTLLPVGLCSVLLCIFILI